MSEAFGNRPSRGDSLRYCKLLMLPAAQYGRFSTPAPPLQLPLRTCPNLWQGTGLRMGELAYEVDERLHAKGCPHFEPYKKMERLLQMQKVLMLVGAVRAPALVKKSGEYIQEEGLLVSQTCHGRLARGCLRLEDNLPIRLGWHKSLAKLVSKADSLSAKRLFPSPLHTLCECSF